jgi:uncharacterized membrane protein (DUF373 family)
MLAKKLKFFIGFISSDQAFLRAIKILENVVSKLLAIAMVLVIIVSVYDLAVVLVTELLTPPIGFFEITLLQIFGLFLNVLIAFEILENITAYLRSHAVQLELVVVTSLTAVARKIIIFDSKATDSDLTSLAIAILTLSISYWIIYTVNAAKKA